MRAPRRAVWGAAAALALAAGCARTTDSGRPRLIEPAQAAALLDSWTEAFILDVSPPDDYAEAHLSGAVNIPRSQLWFRMYDVPADQGAVILVYDAHGRRSEDAAVELRDEGYYRVYALRGGLDAWRAAGLKVQP